MKSIVAGMLALAALVFGALPANAAAFQITGQCRAPSGKIGVATTQWNRVLPDIRHEWQRASSNVKMYSVTFQVFVNGIEGVRASTSNPSNPEAYYNVTQWRNVNNYTLKSRTTIRFNSSGTDACVVENPSY